MLRASTLADQCQAQLSASRGALESSLSRMEGLASSVLPQTEADEALELARALRESAEVAGEPVEFALAWVAGDATPSECRSLEATLGEIDRELAGMASTAARIARSIERRAEARG